LNAYLWFVLGLTALLTLVIITTVIASCVQHVCTQKAETLRSLLRALGEFLVEKKRPPGGAA